MSDPLVGVVMGSASDWSTMQAAVAVLERFGVAHEARVVSAHRMPDEMFAYAEQAAARGLRAIIAGAGGAAHLPGMLAAKTTVPVLGVPVPSRHLQGQDSLLSIVQMPAGVPVATFAIGEAGATNAALFAVADARRRRPAARRRPRAPTAPSAATRRRRRRCRPTRHRVIVPPATIGMLGGGQLGRYTVVAARLMGYGTSCSTPTRRRRPAASPTSTSSRPTTIRPRSTSSPHAARSSRPSSRTRRPPPWSASPPTWSSRRRRRRWRSPRTASAEKRFLAGIGVPTAPFAVPGEARRHRAARRSSRRPASATTARASARSTDGDGVAGGPRRARPCRASSSSGSRSTSSSASSSPARPTDAWSPTRSPRTTTSTASSTSPSCRRGSRRRSAARPWRLAERIADALDYVGVLAVEMFVSDGRLLVNELAPAAAQQRPLDARRRRHQPVRAAGPGGVRAGARPDRARRPAPWRWSTCSATCGSGGEPVWSAVLAEPDARLHLYGKAAARPGRKMGHLTVLGR